MMRYLRPPLPGDDLVPPRPHVDPDAINGIDAVVTLRYARQCLQDAEYWRAISLQHISDTAAAVADEYGAAARALKARADHLIETRPWCYDAVARDIPAYIGSGLLVDVVVSDEWPDGKTPQVTKSDGYSRISTDERTE